MITQVTSGIKVSVEVFYRPDQSNIQLNQHIFAFIFAFFNFTTIIFLHLRE